MNEVSFGFSQCLHIADFSMRIVVSLHNMSVSVIIKFDVI
jgi:hypothetical protein